MNINKIKPISVRITKLMNDDLKILAKIYRQETQDIYRLALSELLIKNNDKITNYKQKLFDKKTFKFMALKEDCWYKYSEENFKFSRNKYDDYILEYIQITDDCIFYSKYQMPETTSKDEIIMKIKKLDLGYILDKNNIIHDVGDIDGIEDIEDIADIKDKKNILSLTLLDSEQEIIRCLCDYYGERIFDEKHYATKKQKENLLNNIYESSEIK